MMSQKELTAERLSEAAAVSAKQIVDLTNENLRLSTEIAAKESELKIYSEFSACTYDLLRTNRIANIHLNALNRGFQYLFSVAQSNRTAFVDAHSTTSNNVVTPLRRIIQMKDPTTGAYTNEVRALIQDWKLHNIPDEVVPFLLESSLELVNSYADHLPSVATVRNITMELGPLTCGQAYSTIVEKDAVASLTHDASNKHAMSLMGATLSGKFSLPLPKILRSEPSRTKKRSLERLNNEVCTFY
jgi:hypothetical protein